MGTTGKLPATWERKCVAPGRYQDGNGLFLLVSKAGSRSWVLRAQSKGVEAGKRRDYGLGSANDVTLAQAREKAGRYRNWLAQGLDPRKEVERVRDIPTFEVAARRVYAENKGEWRNAKHRAQWISSLERFAFPRLGTMKVSDIGTDDVLAVLLPIWLSKHETARRVRQRIGAVLDWAAAMTYRDALSMSVVNRGLPKRQGKVRHHPAMPYDDVAAFVSLLRAKETIARLALEFVILTACRSGEVRGARWAEVDLDAKVWRIPGSRMKAKESHAVPLSTAALDVLQRAKAIKLLGCDLVFPGQRRGRPLSDMALLKVMRDADLKAVPHGFRSTFRDWVAEVSDHSGELAEVALAHTIRDKVQAAYRRGKLLEKRRALMQDWSDWCEHRAA